MFGWPETRLNGRNSSSSCGSETNRQLFGLGGISDVEYVVYHLDESAAWFDGGLNVFVVDCYWLESSCVVQFPQFLWCDLSRVKRVFSILLFFLVCVFIVIY